MKFTDAMLDCVADSLAKDFYDGLTNEEMTALLERLWAAERKECNQFHCGHPTCNVWREVVGK